MKADKRNRSGSVCARSVDPLVPRSYLLPFCVALEHKGAERGRPFLVTAAPVSVLHHKSHQPGVFLVRCKLAHLSELELKPVNKSQLSVSLNMITLPDLSFKKGNIIKTYTEPCNLSLWVDQSDVR